MTSRLTAARSNQLSYREITLCDSAVYTPNGENARNGPDTLYSLPLRCMAVKHVPPTLYPLLIPDMTIPLYLIGEPGFLTWTRGSLPDPWQ